MNGLDCDSGLVIFGIRSEPNLHYLSVFVDSFHLLDLQAALGYVSLIDAVQMSDIATKG